MNNIDEIIKKSTAILKSHPGLVKKHRPVNFPMFSSILAARGLYQEIGEVWKALKKIIINYWDTLKMISWQTFKICFQCLSMEPYYQAGILCIYLPYIPRKYVSSSYWRSV